MPTITPFITFNNQAEEAVQLYTSIFKDAKVTSLSRYPEGMAGMGGQVMSATLVLDGREYFFLNGGPTFIPSEAFSMFVSVQTQAEIDELWEKLTADGGEPGRCGWLKDKFGLSWQIIPTALGEALGDPDPEKAGRAIQAMMQMNKLDIAALRAARDHA